MDDKTTIKKTYNHDRAYANQLSNIVKLKTNEPISKKEYNINKGCIPYLYSAIEYLDTHHKESIIYNKATDSYIVRVTKKTIKKILFDNNSIKQFKDFQYDILKLFKNPLIAKVYLQNTNEIKLLKPIDIKEIVYKDITYKSSRNNLNIKEWDVITIEYSATLKDSCNNSFLTLPTMHYTNIVKYNKALKFMLLEKEFMHYGSRSGNDKNINNPIKNIPYLDHNALYAIINFLLITDNTSVFTTTDYKQKNYNKQIKRFRQPRKIKISDLVNACYSNWQVTNKSGKVSYRYTDIERGIYQALFIHTATLCYSDCDNSHIRLTIDINTIELNREDNTISFDMVDINETRRIMNCNITNALLWGIARPDNKENIEHKEKLFSVLSIAKQDELYIKIMMFIKEIVHYTGTPNIDNHQALTLLLNMYSIKKYKKSIRAITKLYLENLKSM